MAREIWRTDTRSGKVEPEMLVSGNGGVTTRTETGAGGGAQTEAREGPGPNILIDPHRAFWHTSACEVGSPWFLGLCFFFCLPDVCLYDDDNPIKAISLESP